MHPHQHNPQTPATILSIPTAPETVVVRVISTIPEESSGDHESPLQRTSHDASGSGEAFSDMANVSDTTTRGDSGSQASYTPADSAVHATRWQEDRLSVSNIIPTTIGRPPARPSTPHSIRYAVPLHAIPVPSSPPPRLPSTSASRQYRLPPSARSHSPYMFNSSENHPHSQTTSSGNHSPRSPSHHSIGPLRQTHALNRPLANHAYNLDADIGGQMFSVRSESTLQHVRVDVAHYRGYSPTVQIWYCNPYDVEPQEGSDNDHTI